MPNIKHVVLQNRAGASDPRESARSPAGAGVVRKTAAGRVAPASRSTEPIELARARLQARLAGDRVRETVRVRSLAPGIIETTVQPSRRRDAPPAVDPTPLARIHGLLKPHSRYTRLTVVGGASATRVVGTAEGAPPERPDVLARRVPCPSAIINGAYFIHKPGLLDDDGRAIGDIGAPIGPTSHRRDHRPIPAMWRNHYGQLRIGRDTALCSGPLLARDGVREKVPFASEAFLYRLDGRHENIRNRHAGALTSSGDPIERAAISVNPSGDGAHGDVVLHALTAGGSRTNGATMADWQTLTQLGEDSAQGHARALGGRGNASTLALDGGGSTYLGLRDARGVTTLVHGRGRVSGDGIRPTPNIIAATPVLAGTPGAQVKDGMPPLSIDRVPADGS